MRPLFVNYPLDYIVFQISFIIWFVSELPCSFLRRRKSEIQVRDRASRYVLIAAFGIAIPLGIITSLAARQYAIPWDRTMLFWLGIFLMLSGVAFRRYAISVLGKYFTPAVSIQAGQTVVERGPYRYIRHPSYTGALVTFLGMGLALSNWLSLGVLFLGVIVGYGYRVRIEEQTLIEALGEPYKEYMKRTKRFIPFIF